jgi:hypothetical protein
MMVHDSASEIFHFTDRSISSEPSFSPQIGIKHRQTVHELWQKHGRIVGVVCLKSENFKQRQIGVITWYKHGMLVTVMCLNFNNYSIYHKLVIIHGRDNIISCVCIVCTKRFEILTIYSMYRFCSEKCYENYRKMPTEKQGELSNC